MIKLPTFATRSIGDADDDAPENRGRYLKLPALKAVDQPPVPVDDKDALLEFYKAEANKLHAQVQAYRKIHGDLNLASDEFKRLRHVDLGGYSAQAIKDACHRGEIEHRRDGAAWLIHVGSLAKWLLTKRS